jgi:hypothetical protein
MCPRLTCPTHDATEGPKGLVLVENALRVRLCGKKNTVFRVVFRIVPAVYTDQGRSLSTPLAVAALLPLICPFGG